jgi:predicted DNA-binding protein (MmcQ/YjbR family)
MRWRSGPRSTRCAKRVWRSQRQRKNPELFFLPAYVASKGWVGVRLDVVRDWAEMDELIRDSYQLIAPKRLAAQVDGVD